MYINLAALGTVVSCLFQGTHAHGFVTGATVNGQFTAGSDPVWYYLPANQRAKTAGWDSLNQDNGFVEPNRAGTSDAACHKSATAGANFVNVNAGQEITLSWNTWPESHKGPIINYLSNFASSAGSLSFVKVSQSSIISGNTWVTDQLIQNGYKTKFTVPRNLKPGDYVLRHEIIALHSAGSVNGAQLYPQCINLRVGGSGSVGISGGRSGSSLYSANEPGIIFDLYRGATTYTYPGPALWTAAN